MNKHSKRTANIPRITAKPLHVVGRRPDGSYETFTLPLVPDGNGIDTAQESCTARELEFIHCSRPRSEGAPSNG